MGERPNARKKPNAQQKPLSPTFFFVGQAMAKSKKIIIALNHFPEDVKHIALVRPFGPFLFFFVGAFLRTCAFGPAPTSSDISSKSVSDPDPSHSS